MASTADSISMALFCDFENVALGVRDANYEKFDIKRVLERLLLKGSIVVKKAYCDWDRYKSFKSAMHEANFELIEIPHVRQSGKNSADIRLVVDALDLCYTKSHVDTFVIISGDSDFSPLVSKLRENAKQVIGVGVKQSTSDLLIANCDEFIFYDDLVRDSQRAARRDTRDAQQSAKRSPEEEKRRKEELESRRGQAIDIAVETFDALMSERGDSGKIWASMLKEAIKRRKPDFNESYFGFRAFGNLLDEAQARGLLVVGRDEKSGAYVQRPSSVVQPDAVVEVVAAGDEEATATGSGGEAASGLTDEAPAGEAAGKADPGKSANATAEGKAATRGRSPVARRSKVVDGARADGSAPAAAEPSAAGIVAAAPEPVQPVEPAQGGDAQVAESGGQAARRPAKRGNAGGRSSPRGRKDEGHPDEAIEAGAQPSEPSAAAPLVVDTQLEASARSETENATPAGKPAARRRTRKVEADGMGEKA